MVGDYENILDSFRNASDVPSHFMFETCGEDG
jgi:hypothetical protein